MMKSIHLPAVALAGLLMLPAAALACTEPDKPGEFPDPQTAVTAQMVKANNEVKAYVKAMEEYLGCASMSGSKKKKEIEKLEEYAESFNKLIREFKARDK